MSEPTEKHKAEARDIASLWWHEDVEGEAELPAGSLAKLIDRIASTLTSRDSDVREVLEGLRNLNGCWCIVNIGHSQSCITTQKLYNQLQPVKEGEDGD